MDINLIQGSGKNAMNDLKSYEVLLFQQGSLVLTNFLCKARDHGHAWEQAVNAYPNCTITNVYLENRNETPTR